MPATVVHLVRHGEVSNPDGVLYGRRPGFHLSEEGRLMAKAAAGFLAGRDVAVLVTSPLERAQETAAPLAAQFGLTPRIDDRLMEPWNHFEGTRFGVGDGALRRPANWWYLRNPFRPSWGEPYASIAARMRAAMAAAAAAAPGREAVCVGHQLPIWVTRLAAEGRQLWHHPARRTCSLASVTSFSCLDGQIRLISYAEPAGAGRPQVPGA
jgi:broad specificity phosphatase PhoE